MEGGCSRSCADSVLMTAFTLLRNVIMSLRWLLFKKIILENKQSALHLSFSYLYEIQGSSYAVSRMWSLSFPGQVQDCTVRTLQSANPVSAWPASTQQPMAFELLWKQKLGHLWTLISREDFSKEVKLCASSTPSQLFTRCESNGRHFTLWGGFQPVLLPAD